MAVWIAGGTTSDEVVVQERTYDMHVKLDKDIRGLCLCPDCNIPNLITEYKDGAKSFCPKCGKYMALKETRKAKIVK